MAKRIRNINEQIKMIDAEIERRTGINIEERMAQNRHKINAYYALGIRLTAVIPTPYGLAPRFASKEIH